MELVIALILGAAVALGLALVSATGRKPLQRRLARLADGSSVRITQPEKEGVLTDDRSGWLLNLLAPFGRSAPGAPSVNPIRQRLVQAGYRRESALVIFMKSRILLALLLPALVLLFPLTWGLGETRLVVLMCMAAGIGYVGPSAWIDRKRQVRQRHVELGLPDALDLMVICVEAGLGVNASLARVAEEFVKTNPVLSAEFELVTLETRAGKSSAAALRALAERTGVTDVSALVAMLIQTERFGTSLAHTLRVHADAMRVRRLQRAEELAAKAPLKMLFPTAIIFIATLLVTIGPGMIRLMGFFREIV